MKCKDETYDEKTCEFKKPDNDCIDCWYYDKKYNNCSYNTFGG